MKYLEGFLLPALLALAPSAIAKNAPLVKESTFGNELVNLQYFDDSTVVLVQELGTGNIYRSEDAGKEWEELKSVKGLGIIKNPYDNKVALVLGEEKHYITFDQGENWQDFKTEYSPTPGGPVSWHSQDNKKILIHEIEDCLFSPCLGKTYYTKDGFKQHPKFLSRSAECANGQRDLSVSLKDRTNTMTVYCASCAANTRIAPRTIGS